MSRRTTRRARRLPARRLLYLAVFVGAALVGSAFVRVSLQDNALAREEAAARAQIVLLEAQQAALKADVAMRETPAYVEQQAHELGYVKPGEGLASVKDVAPRSSPQQAATPTETRLDRWLTLFFHP